LTGPFELVEVVAGAVVLEIVLEVAKDDVLVAKEEAELEALVVAKEVEVVVAGELQ